MIRITRIRQNLNEIHCLYTYSNESVPIPCNEFDFTSSDTDDLFACQYVSVYVYQTLKCNDFFYLLERFHSRILNPEMLLGLMKDTVIFPPPMVDDVIFFVSENISQNQKHSQLASMPVKVRKPCFWV